MARFKVLLISILKPIDDSRMYEKIGMTLAKIDKAEIHIAGFHSNNIPKNENINFYPLFNFSRLSPKRLQSSWKTWKLLIKVKPQLIIPNTHELLLVITLYRIIFGGRIVYDVQENYFKNLWYGNQFPFLIKHILAVYVRVKEWLLAPFIQSFLLAERCYNQEMKFMRKKGIIIENKFKEPENFHIADIKTRAPLKLLYTGTIANLYGIQEVIKLAEDLLSLSTGNLTIIGYCPESQLLNQIRNRIHKDHRIVLIGGSNPVPHTDILQKIHESNLGLIGYKNNPAISGKIPTRLYEYLACQLPFILPNNPSWVQLADKYNAGIAIDFTSYNPELILEYYFNRNFYSSPPGDEVLFNSQEDLVQSILNN